MGSSVIAVILGYGFLVSTCLLFHCAARRQTVFNMWIVSLIAGGGLLIWYAMVTILGQNGFFAATPLIAPNILFGFFFIFIALNTVYRLPAARSFFDSIPLHWMMFVHIWRIGGVVFITLYFAGALPAEFAFPAGIGDVLTGIVAPFVAVFYITKKSYSKRLALAWNYLGVFDLIMSISIGILAFPETFPPLIDGQILSTTPPTGIFALYPMVLIPLFAVPLSLFLHAITLRTLKKS